MNKNSNVSLVAFYVSSVIFETGSVLVVLHQHRTLYSGDVTIGNWSVYNQNISESFVSFGNKSLNST